MAKSPLFMAKWSFFSRNFSPNLHDPQIKVASKIKVARDLTTKNQKERGRVSTSIFSFIPYSGT
jgi:hypothetical protein